MEKEQQIMALLAEAWNLQHEITSDIKQNSPRGSKEHELAIITQQDFQNVINQGHRIVSTMYLQRTQPEFFNTSSEVIEEIVTVGEVWVFKEWLRKKVGADGPETRVALFTHTSSGAVVDEKSLALMVTDADYTRAMRTVPTSYPGVTQEVWEAMSLDERKRWTEAQIEKHGN